MIHLKWPFLIWIKRDSIQSAIDQNVIVLKNIDKQIYFRWKSTKPEWNINHQKL